MQITEELRDLFRIVRTKIGAPIFFILFTKIGTLLRIP